MAQATSTGRQMRPGSSFFVLAQENQPIRATLSRSIKIP
jgi:hypothetical protein